MIVSKHVPAGGAPAAVAGTWTIVAPAGTGAVRVYRRTLRLRLPTGGAADGIVVDAAATALAGTFSTLDYDALHAPHAGLAAVLSGSGSATVAALDGPRQVRKVRLVAAAVPLRTVELHRLDGDKIVDDATASAADNAALPDFTDRRFAIKATGAVSELHVRSYPTGPRIGLAPAGSPDAATFFWRADGELGRPFPAGDPAPHPPASAATVAAGPALAATLQRLLDDLPAPLPPQVEIDLVLESDAPCTLAIGSFAVAYRLASRSFAGPGLVAADLDDAGALAQALHRRADPAATLVHARLSAAGQRLVSRGADVDAAALAAELSEVVAGAPLDAAADNRAFLEAAFPGTIASRTAKRTLRFPGGRAETRELALLLPAGATVAGGALRTVESLRGDRPAAGAGTIAGELDQKSGVRLGADAAAATATAQPAPLAATGLAVALLATTERAELVAELRADHLGGPDGQTLAEAPLVLEGAGRRSWATVSFADPLALPAEPVWVVLRAAAGGAVWLADENGGEARVLEPASGAVRTALPGVAPLHRLLARSAALAAEPGAALALGGTALAPQQADGETSYPVAAALAAALAGAPAGTLVTIPLRVTAAVAGSVTVQPPELEYDLPAL